MREFETVIGLEVHVELSTRSKLFCACSAGFGAAPNTNTCPVCLGMPGALPVLNRQVLQHAVAAGLALNCEINRSFRFDRKNYFYPDNPQNYQISQLYTPIAVNGRVGAVRIREIHMEEDAGKLIHEESTGDTLIDYNRAGVPLIEIVTEPDMRTAEEVTDFLTGLRTTLVCLGVSDCRMNEGSLRVDVNLSVRERPVFQKNTTPSAIKDTYAGDEHGAFGTRTEMKNLNSFKAITRAIANERDRQIALLESGTEVEQETRRWDDDRGVSVSMRSKEDARDYRYFPDPDLPLFTITEEEIAAIRDGLPELPAERAERYRETYQLPDFDIGILATDITLARIFDETVELGAEPKQVSNWLIGETLRILKEREQETDSLTLKPQTLCDLIALTQAGTINSTTAKDVFAVIFDEDIEVEKYVDEHGLATVHDTAQLEAVVDRVIAENPQPVADFRAGKTKAVGFLIGQAMRETGGKADPEQIRSLLSEKLA